MIPSPFATLLRFRLVWLAIGKTISPSVRMTWLFSLPPLQLLWHAFGSTSGSSSYDSPMGLEYFNFDSYGRLPRLWLGYLNFACYDTPLARRILLWLVSSTVDGYRTRPKRLNRFWCFFFVCIEPLRRKLEYNCEYKPSSNPVQQTFKISSKSV